MTDQEIITRLRADCIQLIHERDDALRTIASMRIDLRATKAAAQRLMEQARSAEYIVGAVVECGTCAHDDESLDCANCRKCMKQQNRGAGWERKEGKNET